MKQLSWSEAVLSWYVNNAVYGQCASHPLHFELASEHVLQLVNISNALYLMVHSTSTLGRTKMRTFFQNQAPHVYWCSTIYKSVPQFFKEFLNMFLGSPRALKVVSRIYMARQYMKMSTLEFYCKHRLI